MRWLLGKYGENIGRNIPIDSKNKSLFILLISVIVFAVIYILSFYI